MSKVGILSTVAEAPVKPLVQTVLEIHPGAVLINPFGRRHHDDSPDEVNADTLASLNLGSFDRLIHDGNWLQMSKASREIIRQALDGGTTIQIVKGLGGEN